MAGEWKETTLGECAQWLSGGTPFKGNEAFWSGPIPWVSAKDMKSFRLHDAEDHISPIAVGNGGKLVPAGTILLLVRGMTLHNDVPICMVTREMAFNQDIKALRPAKNVDGAFLAYWLLANKPELLASVDHAGHGTGRLVTDTLKEKPVQLPPLAEQKAIAAVLGSLDDKIELNRRMNATLEAMARALFQSWFVDFDPVRQNMDAKPAPSPIPEAANLPAGEAGGKWLTYAIECQGGSLYIGQTDNLRRRWKQHVDGKGAEWTKAHPPVALVFWETHNSLEAAVAREAKLKSGSGREWLKQKIAERTSVRLPAGEAGAKLDGRPPAALDPATAALFPDSFQDSEAGHIPKGWTIQPVGEVVDCVGGGTPSTAEPKYWEGGTHHWTTPKDFSSLEAPVLLDTDRKLTDAGIAKISSGLLPAGTLLLSSRAPVGYLAIAAMPVAINQGFIALKCNERASNYFMLNWCQTNMAEIESRATGTTFAEISKQNFRPIRVVLPPKELMAAFTAKVAPLYVQITANLHQSRTLATLRDTLLPKLLSGELKTSN